MRPARVDPHDPGQHDLSNSPAPIRSTARRTASSKCSGGASLTTRGATAGSGSSSGIDAGRSSSSRASTGSASPTAVTVSAARPRYRTSEISGRTICAGANDPHSGPRPPAGANQKPPTKTSPAPGMSIRS